jgi:flagellar motor switch protein FliM
MALDRVLSQEEIDRVFQRHTRGSGDASAKAQAYDFRRPDRIAKDQLAAIRMMHENFARTLASSLSAYLRAYVVVNLVSVEQLSFSEFIQCLPSPTVICALSMNPVEGNMVLEMSPSLVFPIIEILLGGSSRSAGARPEREITEIEESILSGIYRIILNDMQVVWHSVTELEFEIDSRETEPQMLQLLSPNEAVVAIAMEVRVGEHVGMLNLGIPSIIIKMLRQKFNQQWSVRKSGSTSEEREKLLKILGPAAFHVDARLTGPRVTAEQLLSLNEGDTLALDYSIDKPLSLQINGLEKMNGRVVDAGFRRAFVVEQFTEASALAR